MQMTVKDLTFQISDPYSRAGVMWSTSKLPKYGFLDHQKRSTLECFSLRP